MDELEGDTETGTEEGKKKKPDWTTGTSRKASFNLMSKARVGDSGMASEDATTEAPEKPKPDWSTGSSRKASFNMMSKARVETDPDETETP